MIVLKEVKASEKDKLQNLLQKYLHEMTNFYDLAIDGAGNYEYKYLDCYFREDKITALFIYSDGTLVGFAMINGYSCLGNSIDYSIAEFTVFPMYRNHSFALEAIKEIFGFCKGRWEIKYSGKNIAAEKLWRRATEKYNPLVSTFGEDDFVLSFTVE